MYFRIGNRRKYLEIREIIWQEGGMELLAKEFNSSRCLRNIISDIMNEVRMDRTFSTQ
jgi:hypothetical protein